MKFTFDPKMIGKKNNTHFVVLKSTAQALKGFVDEASAASNAAERNAKAENLGIEARYVVCELSEGSEIAVVAA